MAAIAAENIEIFRSGEYLSPDGRKYDIGVEIEKALGKTVVVDTETEQEAMSIGCKTRITVVAENTLAGLKRLQGEGHENVAVLNFASATSPGGGFLRGGEAQEEDVCRATTLYGVLAEQPGFYARNRAWPDALYSDSLIYSPHIVVFRDC